MQSDTVVNLETDETDIRSLMLRIHPIYKGLTGTNQSLPLGCNFSCSLRDGYFRLVNPDAAYLRAAKDALGF